ncbi:hypothetical protein MRX96_041942 [Rhipicephalus microplus]
MLTRYGQRYRNARRRRLSVGNDAAVVSNVPASHVSDAQSDAALRRSVERHPIVGREIVLIFLSSCHAKTFAVPARYGVVAQSQVRLEAACLRLGHVDCANEFPRLKPLCYGRHQSQTPWLEN